MQHGRRYRRRAPEVEAVIVAADTADQAALWAGGRVEYLAEHPVIRLPRRNGVAHIGDYLVRAVLHDKLGPAYVMDADLFEHFYAPALDQAGRRHTRREPDPQGGDVE